MSESGSAAVASLPTGMDPSIHSDVFARYERGVLEIEHRVDDNRNFTHPSEGMKLRQLRMITLSVHRRVDSRRHSVEPDVVAAYSSANATLDRQQSLHKEPFKRSAESYTPGSPAFY
jgi:hypothetical protein